MGAWPGPMPGGFPAAALPLVSPVQGSLKGNCVCPFILHYENMPMQLKFSLEKF